MKPASISRQAITLIMGRGLASTFTFLIPVILARHLSPSDYGTFKQIFLVYSTIFMILPLGMIQSLYYFIPKDPDHVRSYLAQSLIFLQASGLVALLFLLVFRRNIAEYFNNPALTSYFLQLGLFIFLMLSSSFFEALLISSQKINQAALLSFLSEASKTGMMLAPLLIWGDLTALMWGMNLFAFFRFSFTMFYIFRQYPFSLADFRWPSFRTQLAYSLPFGLAVVLQVTQDNLHQYVVAATYSPAIFAVYSVGMFQLPLIDLISTPMSQLLIVRMTALARQDGTANEVAVLWHDITRKLAMVFIPSFVFLQVMAGQVIVLLFTEAYLSSVALFRIAVFSFLTAILLSEGALRAYANTAFILKITFMKLVLTLLLIFPFLNWFGLKGGIVALILVLTIAKSVALWKLSALIPLNFSRLLPWRDLLRISVFSSICAAPLLLIKSIHFPSMFVLLAVAGSVYTTFYLLFLFTSSLVSFDEKREIARMIRRVGGRFPAFSKF